MAGVVAKDGAIYRAPRVVSAVHPKLLFGKLIDAALSREIAEDINDYVTVSGTFRMNVALDELPDFTALPGKHRRSIIQARSSSARRCATSTRPTTTPSTAIGPKSR